MTTSREHISSYSSPTKEDIEKLIGTECYRIWYDLCSVIDGLYDMERAWNSGGKKWTHEYKYRRGGKTLCALYAKEDCAGFMVILGGAEQKKFEAQRQCFSPKVCSYYDEATTYHDGKWIMFPLDATMFDDYKKILAIKRKLNKDM